MIIQFTLAFNDFGVKYFGKEHADHLIQDMKSEGDGMKTDWTGNPYFGLTLGLDCEARTLGRSMPGYIEKLLLKFIHTVTPVTHRIARTGHHKKSTEKGRTIQYYTYDTSKRINKDRINVIQQVV